MKKKPPATAPRPADPLAGLDLRPGQSIELLQALHILTRDGRINQDSRRKLKQVYHLYQFIEPLLADAFAHGDDPVLVDHGAGKSYLGFILYDLYFKARPAGRIYGIETRPELVDTSRALADRLGFARMHFLNLTVDASIASPELPTPVDIVTALHACDTATDDAIRFALARRRTSSGRKSRARPCASSVWKSPMAALNWSTASSPARRTVFASSTLT